MHAHIRYKQALKVLIMYKGNKTALIWLMFFSVDGDRSIVTCNLYLAGVCVSHSISQAAFRLRPPSLPHTSTTHPPSQWRAPTVV